jgi:hypothetical protein
MRTETPQFLIEFLDAGRSAQCAPNPRFPNGIDVPRPPGVPADAPVCKVDLQYPAPRVGAYLIECQLCGVKVAITVAGRVDDPRSMEVPCKRFLSTEQ